MRQLVMGLSALLLVLVPVPAPRAADATFEAIEHISVLAVEGDAYINADGTLADYRIDTPAPGDTAARVLAVARGWHFEPVLADGKPQAVVARMRVALAATQVGETYQVRVDRVSFPGLEDQRSQARDEGLLPSLAHHRPVRYPRGLEKTGISGRVLLALRYDDAGRMLDVAALQSMIFDRRESPAVNARAIELFEHAALDVARSWRVESATSAPFRTAVTAIDFVMATDEKHNRDGTSDSGKWRLVSRTPKRQVEWLDAKPSGAPSVSDVAGGQLVPLADAPLKLREPVAGTLL